jgi:hypothetical protein
MTRGELEALIDAGDAEACIIALQGMPEAERTKLGAAAVARLRAHGKGVSPQLAPFIDSEAVGQVLQAISMDRPRLERYLAARAAVLATASFSQWKGVKGHGLPSNEMAFRILSDRRPEWLGELVEQVCDEVDQLNMTWPLIRRLVREGYCAAPRSASYIDRMLSALASQSPRWTTGGPKRSLLDDPGLLEHEIWRIFETEPGRGAVQLFTLAIQGAPPEATWEGALVELAGEGRISRDRLLDASLDGLSRDLHEMRAKWFAVIHDRLEPTLEERGARGARYLDFLGSRNPSTVAFALKVLKELLKAGRVEAAAVVDRLSPAFHSRTKATMKQAIALLDLAVRREGDPAHKARAVVVAAEGLVHEAADVQAAILDFVERHGDSDDAALNDLLAARLESIAVSLRDRLAAWLNLRAAPTDEPVADDLVGVVERAGSLDPRLAGVAGVPEALEFVRGARPDLPALTFDGTEIPRLDPGRRLEPIDDLDTLIELCSRLIEDLKPLEDVDRCVDAISRLCDGRPADFEKRTAPLAARIRKRLAEPPSLSTLLLSYFGVVVKSWLTSEVADPIPFNRFRALDGFMSAWVIGLSRRVGRAKAAPLLAAPTHAGGWIDPRILVDRFRRRSRLPIADEPADLILALLRLAPDQRSAALADARDLEREPGAVIRYALGSSGETIGPTAALWVAAARARSPWADDPAVEARHPGLGPDAGRAASYHIHGNELIRRHAASAQPRIDREPAVPEGEQWMPDLPTVSYHCLRRFSVDRWPSLVSVWPAALESFFATGVQQLVEASEASSDWKGMRGFLLPLLDPDVPLRPMARLLLAIGLNAKLPELSSLATDATVAAVADGRLDADSLGKSLRIAWQLRIETSTYVPVHHPSYDAPQSVGFVKPVRLAKALGDVARASPLHAGIVARALESVLADDASACRTTASMLLLLELLKEALVAAGWALSAPARAYFSGLGDSGKTGRVVGELLALSEVSGAPACGKRQTQALASRISRAGRWSAWEHGSC